MFTRNRTRHIQTWFVFAFQAFACLNAGMVWSQEEDQPRNDSPPQVISLDDQAFAVSLPPLIVQSIPFTIEFEPQTLLARQLDGPVTIIINGKPVSAEFKGGIITAETLVQDEHMLDIEVLGFRHVAMIRPMSLWLAILPPLVAIAFALIFKEVVFSLVTGIALGSVIMGWHRQGPWGLVTGFLAIIDRYIIDAMNQWGHLAIIIFSTLIGGLVAVVSRNGGMKGVVQAIARFARTPRSGQLATWMMGVAIFFDDYANTLVVGNTMRPVTDRLRVSREKLAYLVDSTAAPIAAIAFVTTWIGAELAYIQDGISKIPAIPQDEGVYSIFLRSLPYSFYPVFTLFFGLMIILTQRDFGPMLKAEIRARRGAHDDFRGDLDLSSETRRDMEVFSPQPGVPPRWFNAVIPIGIVILGTVLGLVVTGYQASKGQLADLGIQTNSIGSVWQALPQLPRAPESVLAKLGVLVGQSDSYTALLWSSFSGLLCAILMSVGQRLLTLKDAVASAVQGFETMLQAILILVLAWSLALVTEDMHTAEFITGILGTAMPTWGIPALTFLLAAFVSFSTGSSWGTMAILYPLMLPASWTLCAQAGMEYDACMAVFIHVVSCVLAGSVLGDHCSPISDTTILSSLASSCHHIDHVQTQLPYALSAGAVSLTLGTIPAAFGISPWILMPVGMIAMFLLIRTLGKTQNSSTPPRRTP